MTRRRIGDRPLSEAILTRFICGTRVRWNVSLGLDMLTGVCWSVGLNWIIHHSNFCEHWKTIAIKCVSKCRLCLQVAIYVSWVRFLNAYEPLAPTFSTLNSNCIFYCKGNMFVFNFKSTLWTSSHNIVPIHWKMCSLLGSKNFRAPRFTSSWAFFL